MFLEEDIIDEVIKNLGFIILDKKILVCRFPLYALGTKDKKIALIEILPDRKNDFIIRHIKWWRENRKAFETKYNFLNQRDINLICFYLSNDEINFTLPSFIKNVQVFSPKIIDNKWVWERFLNFTINSHYIKEILFALPNKRIRYKMQKLLFKKAGFRPFICRKLSPHRIVIETLQEKHYLYVYKNFVFYHKGKSPFRPLKIT